MNLRLKYASQLQRFKNLPDYRKTRAEHRFLLLREFEERFEPNERKKLGPKYRRHNARKDFCEQKGISITTFLRWRRLEIEYGMIGLIPLYGNRKVQRSDIDFHTEVPAKKRTSSKFVTSIVRVDVNNPLDCARVVKGLIESRSNLTKKSLDKILTPFSFILSYNKPHFFKPQSLQLSPDEIKPLKRYIAKTHRNHWAKALALFMASEGNSLFQISLAVGRAPNTIQRWFRLYRLKGLDFIETRLAEEQRKKMWENRSIKVMDILHSPPITFGINRTSWTYDTIIQAYAEKHGEALPKGSLKRIVKDANYTWRHARKVLTSNDPNYKEKVKKVLSTLRNTKEDEAFFFVDEMGPYRVKKYGGKAITIKNSTKKISASQVSGGKVQAIAALEAFTNQMTWHFTNNKEAATIILLFESLRSLYSNKRTIFITWDAISTHNSRDIKEWIQKNNNDVKNIGSGPRYKIVPLPSKSQFLNVIESVFSGMKRSVIHNSDYPSSEEMEKAINRHFEERNAFYLKNPKRAGNKIWDKELFDLDKLKGGLFKKM